MKKTLLTTTALASSLLGYYRKAYSACTLGSSFFPSSISYTCSGGGEVNFSGTLTNQTGVSVQSLGSETVTININGEINASSYAFIGFGSHDADFNINISQDGILNSDGVGIYSASNTDIEVNGKINSEDYGIHVYANYNNIGGRTKITVQNNGEINSSHRAISTNYSKYVDITVQNGGKVHGTNRAISSGYGGYSADSIFNIVLDGTPVLNNPSSKVSITSDGRESMSLYFFANNFTTNYQLTQIDRGGDKLTIKGEVYIDGDVKAGDGLGDELIFENANIEISQVTDFIGFESITVSGDNSFTGDFNLSAIDLSDNSGLKINGSMSVDNLEITQNSTLSGNSTINGNLTAKSGSTISPGNSIGAINVNGNISFENGSTLDIEVNGNNSDQILANNGDITIDPNANLEITPLNNSDSGSLVILKANGGVINGEFNNVTVNSGNNSSLVYNNLTNSLSVSLLAANTSIFNAQIQSSVNNSILFNDTLVDQIASESFEKGNNVWMKAVNRNQNSRAAGVNSFAFSNDANGFVVGGEKAIDSNYKLGFSASQISDNMRVESRQGSKKSQSTFASIYGVYAKESFFSSLSFGLGYHDGENKRLVNNNGNYSYADSNFKDIDINAALQFGAKFKLLKDFYAMPYFSTSYIHTFAGGYRENNGGDGAITINDYDFGTIKYRESIKFGSNQPLKIFKINVSPYLDLGFAQERAVGERKLSGSFNANNSSFSTVLNDNERNFVTAGAGLKAKITNDISASLSYERSKSNQERRDDIRFGVGVKF